MPLKLFSAVSNLFRRNPPKADAPKKTTAGPRVHARRAGPESNELSVVEQGTREAKARARRQRLFGDPNENEGPEVQSNPAVNPPFQYSKG